MSDLDGITVVRDYPTDKDAVEYSVTNQIKWDLKGTFGWRAVATVTEGRVVDWFAHHPDYNDVVVFWPDYYDEPVWVRESIYAFSNGMKYQERLVMCEWPDKLDEDAEVIG